MVFVLFCGFSFYPGRSIQIWGLGAKLVGHSEQVGYHERKEIFRREFIGWKDGE
jgi:hypothetical protein